MLKESIFTAALSRLVHIPFALKGERPFTPPQKALILKPCCVSQVMLTTPLLAVLSQQYPNTRFDWAISDWARPAIIGNPRLTEFISTGAGGMDGLSWRDLSTLVKRLEREQYDTVFIPSRSSLLSLAAWMAHIPQRIGLQVDGRGFAHTHAVVPVPNVMQETAVYLSLATAAGVSDEAMSVARMEFYPPDSARTAVTERLIDDVDWLGGRPLFIIHPGGGRNPVRTDRGKQWPMERFVRLINGLSKKYNAQILLVGDADDKPLVKKIASLTSIPAADWSGRMDLGEIGALSEVADLYIGHDTGPTHVATAVGCPVLAIFGPSDPRISQPHTNRPERLRVLAQENRNIIPFAWDDSVSIEAALQAVDTLLSPPEESTII